MAHEVPKATLLDHAHAAAKAVLSLVPVVGGPAVELFQQVVQPPLDKRRNEWMASVGAQLEELNSRGLDLGALQHNEQFVTALVQASAAAIRTHQQEKLIALRNAIKNIATGQGPDETMQHILLNMIDDFSEMHIRILAFARAPSSDRNTSSGSLSHVLERHIPALAGHRELYDQIWKDLYTRGLVNTESLQAMMSGNGLVQSRTTALGNSLISLIS